MQRFEARKYGALLGMLAVGGVFIFAAFHWRLSPETPPPVPIIDGSGLLSQTSFNSDSTNSGEVQTHRLVEPPLPWRSANTREQQEAKALIRNHLFSFKRGRYNEAMSCQSTRLRDSFASPGALRTMIENSYPIFAHFRRVDIGPIQCDAEGEHFSTRVRLQGENWTAQALYELTREDGQLLVGSVNTESSSRSFSNSSDSPQEPLPILPKQEGPEV
jgi:hypothetical protein